MGATIFSYITATVSSVITDYDIKSTKFRKKMTTLLQFLQRTTLSNDLKGAVVKQMSHQWRNPMAMQDVKPLIGEMPRVLRYQVSLQLYERVINKSDFFQTFYDDHLPFVAELTSKLQPLKCSAGEYLCNAGDRCEYWFIIDNGEAEFVSTTDADLVYHTLQDGMCFGLVGMLITRHWNWHVRVSRNSTMFRIPTRDLFDVLGHHRDCYRICVKMAHRTIEDIKQVKGFLQSTAGRQSRQFSEVNIVNPTATGGNLPMSETFRAKPKLRASSIFARKDLAVLQSEVSRNDSLIEDSGDSFDERLRKISRMEDKSGSGISLDQDALRRQTLERQQPVTPPPGIPGVREPTHNSVSLPSTSLPPIRPGGAPGYERVASDTTVLAFNMAAQHAKAAEEERSKAEMDHGARTSHMEEINSIVS
eukprot:823862_1